MINIHEFSGFPCDGKVRLIKKLNESSGFYVCDGDPIYATTDLNVHTKSKERDTSFLKLILGAKLKPIQLGEVEGPCEAQDFDLVRLINWQEADNETRIVETFLDLCEIHAIQQTDVSFEDFFYSLAELFQPYKEESTLNAYGLYCELAFMDLVAKRTDVPDITKFWQLDGNTSKYDFVFPKGNLEIKSCTKECKVLVKHDQLFNGDDNYLVAITVERNSSGESLISLMNRLIERTNCFTTLRARVELERRVLQINNKDLNRHYHVNQIRCFPVGEINMFKILPDRVSSVTYKLDLADIDYEEPNALISKLVQ